MNTVNINGKNFTIEELNKLIEGSKDPLYPIYCLHLPTGKIFKFTDLSEGVVVKSGSDWREYPIGLESKCLIEHTHKYAWKPVPVCSKTGFFHGQLVWAWDKEHTHYRILAFYDAENSCVFSIRGKKSILAYDSYLPFEGNWPDWTLEAYKTLELYSHGTKY